MADPDTCDWQREHDWLRKLPKVELHVHLEGAIPVETLWQLIRTYGDASVPDLETLRTRFIYRDFPHFLSMWTWKNGFLRSYDDFTFIAEAVAASLAGQNIRYAEVFFSPTDFSQHGLEPQSIAAAVRRGFDRVQDIRIALVADLVRDTGPERAQRTLAEIAEVRDLGVVGIGIGGSEHRFPAELFRDVFEKARQIGFHTSAHAGEASGSDSIWGAIRALRVDRIGHGTRAGEDESLLEHLQVNQIPLEMCPLSNVRTGVVATIQEHPVMEFLSRGLFVSVNTDDPAMFGNSLADEFLHLRRELGATRDDVRQLILNGVRTSWMEESQKQATIDATRNDAAWADP